MADFTEISKLLGLKGDDSATEGNTNQDIPEDTQEYNNNDIATEMHDSVPDVEIAASDEQIKDQYDRKFDEIREQSYTKEGKFQGKTASFKVLKFLIPLGILVIIWIVYSFASKSGSAFVHSDGDHTVSQKNGANDIKDHTAVDARGNENESSDQVPKSSETAPVVDAADTGVEQQDVEYILPTAVPEEYYYFNGHTYAFYDASRYGFSTYDEVSDFCHEQGGHLAVINDRSENSYLYDLMKNNYNITVFFGYTDKDEEGDWVWDGDESDYENWTRSGDWNLPDNGESWGGGEWENGGEDYAEFNYDMETNWGAPNDTTWNDATFMENTTIFFCEWDYDIREAGSGR